MTSHKKIRFALFAVLAVLTAALAFTAALRFADESRDETAQQEAPPANAGGEAEDSRQRKAEAAPDKETASGETPLDASSTGVSDGEAQETSQQSHAHDKTALGALGPDLERWLQIARTQLEERGEQGAELERMLEWRRKAMESMDPSGWEEFLDNSGIAIWKWNPEFSDLQNRIFQKLFELNITTGYPKDSESTPPEIIEVLVEGLDDLAAAKRLRYSVEWRSELNYANIYVDRALAKDPTSREALIFKARLAGSTLMAEMEVDGVPVTRRRIEKVDGGGAARRLIELYPDDKEAAEAASFALYYDYPEEAIAFLEPLAPKEGYNWAHRSLSAAYERLDMIDMANYHTGLVEPNHHITPLLLTPESRRFPSIWEERAAAAAAEAALQTSPPAESVAPGFESPPDPRDFEPPTPHDHPDAPRGVEPPPSPPGAEMDMAAAYANFAKAYQDAFEMEYGLSEATPEGYMNALLGMARAFAKAGDAQHAQDAYNAVRKRNSREEVERVFRRFDEQERLKRQPPSGGDDNGEEETDD